jgi:hypothetical protein
MLGAFKRYQRTKIRFQLLLSNESGRSWEWEPKSVRFASRKFFVSLRERASSMYEYHNLGRLHVNLHKQNAPPSDDYVGSRLRWSTCGTLGPRPRNGQLDVDAAHTLSLVRASRIFVPSRQGLLASRSSPHCRDATKRPQPSRRNLTWIKDSA